MASPFPSTLQPTSLTPSWVAPEFLHPPSSQESLPSSHLGLCNMANTWDLSLPPNALRTIAQVRASGRLSVLRNHHVGQPDGAGNLKSVVAGKPTAVQPHSNPTALKPASTPRYALGVPEAEQSAQSPGVTLHQSSRVKVRARAGKSKAKWTGPLVARHHTGAATHRLHHYRSSPCMQHR
jgi:hypothetical protein